MKKVKISVLKTTFDKELADKYGVDGTWQMSYAKPEEFCDGAKQDEESIIDYTPIK